MQLVIETKNESVKAGDWIIENGTNAGECYATTDKNMRKNYRVENESGKNEYEWNEYECVSGVRLGVIVDENVAGLLLNSVVHEDGKNLMMSQADLISVVLNENCPSIRMRKKKSVKAVRVEHSVTIVTYVEVSVSAKVVDIATPWDSTQSMPVHMGDILCICENEDMSGGFECYRIARAEWNQTYELAD
ncbi:MAG: hypothetical protein CMQ41_07615 [Gammaproteobacteria bacterium]|nr:hypothetical protein [Gammaproteobacteria bacterium]|tara:strand:+ start:186 stop:755 length:570 start_codon:yes stop_codon:yes gene_type:complete